MISQIFIYKPNAYFSNMKFMLSKSMPLLKANTLPDKLRLFKFGASANIPLHHSSVFAGDIRRRLCVPRAIT